jgi:outer membrane protein OmpA-like peptidoglycan-associated protein
MNTPKVKALVNLLSRRLRPPATTWKLFRCVLVLITCTYAKALAQEQSSSAATLPLSISILYFDQSSHLLRPRVKTTLDSIARLLVGQVMLIASVTGYTDNVGKPELNLTLAESRAKMVETYLKQRGVPGNQIIVKWEGPDSKASVGESKAVETISRRVAILLYPR